LAGVIHILILDITGVGVIHITHTVMVGDILLAMVLIGVITPTTTHGDTHTMAMEEVLVMETLHGLHMHPYVLLIADYTTHAPAADQQIAEQIIPYREA
jgi:uncharacterized membrane protein YeiB